MYYSLLVAHLDVHYPTPTPNQAFYREGVDDETWKPLLASEARPVYKEVEDALKAADVPFRLTEFDSVV